MNSKGIVALKDTSVCMKCLKKKATHTYTIYGRGYGSSFDMSDTKFQCCDDCDSPEYEEWFKKNNESISKLLEYVDSIIPLVDKEELDTFRNDEQPQFNENFKALQTQCEENKAKVFECLNENEYELEDKRIITPNKKLNKLRKYCFIGITICAVIFLVLLITGIATKINILSYLSIIPALGIGVIFYIFYRKTK